MGEQMEYISVSSLVTDFWNILFYPLIKISLILILMRIIFGKDRFNRIQLKVFDIITKYSQKIKYRERLNKAVPIVNTFLIFSFLYLFSIFSSAVESFFHMNISFGSDNHISSKTVLNVWEYHPYIEDFSTLQDVVYYKAEESELGVFKLLSTEGLRKMPEMLLRSSIIFVLILLIFLIMCFVIEVIKQRSFKRIFIILRTNFVLLILTCLFVGISFLNKNYITDYNVRAWGQYELQVLSSGAPPESDIDIKKEKLDEVNRHIDNRYYDFDARFGFGSKGISVTYINHHFEFHTDNYRY